MSSTDLEFYPTPSNLVWRRSVLEWALHRDAAAVDITKDASRTGSTNKPCCALRTVTLRGKVNTPTRKQTRLSSGWTAYH